MPSANEKRAHGGVARVRTIKRGGKTIRIYFYKDRSSYAEGVKKHTGRAPRRRRRATK